MLPRSVLPVLGVLALFTAAPPPAAAAPPPEPFQLRPAPEPAAPTIMVEAASPAAAERIAARQGMVVKRAFSWIGWYELELQGSPAGAEAALQALADDPAVTDTDVAVEGEDFGPQYTPRDPFWTGNINVQSGTLNGMWHLQKANFPAAFDHAKGTGVLIGIVDSEFYTDHKDLGPKVRNPRSFASGTPNYGSGNVKADGSNPNVESTMHGSHVAGIAAAATDNGLGGSGAGFDANFVPAQIRTVFEPGGGAAIDAGFVADLVEALGYMSQQGVSVINLSLGGPRDHPPIAAAIAGLRAQGITIVVAAGNAQQSSPNAPMYPAAYPGAFAVANTDSKDAINPTSSNGQWVDISAPGTDVLATWDSRSQRPESFPVANDVDRYGIISGTSMAAPAVAGLVALMKSVRPDLTPDEVEALIQGTAFDLGSSGHDPQYGWGRIDANRAVQAAIAYVRPTPPPPPAPPADTAAPAVTLRGATTLKGRQMTVRFLCSEGCKGQVRIFLQKGKAKKGKRPKKGKRLGSRTFTGLPGKRVVVKVRSGRKIRKKTKVIVQIKVADGAGNATTLEFPKTLK